MSKNESPTLEVVEEVSVVAEEQPTQAEGPPMAAIPPRERLEQLQARLAEFSEAMGETRTKLESLQKSLRKMDTEDSEEVEKILDGLPAATPKGVIDKIFKLSKPKRTQLSDNIGKLKISLEVLGRKKTQARREIKDVEKQIDDERYDDETRSVCDLLTEWLEVYVHAEAIFDKLTAVVPKTGDPAYFKRCTKLGYPQAYEVICDSHLRLSNINSMSMTELAERIAGLEGSYGPPLLQKRLDRQQDVPLRRDEFMPKHAMFGKI